MASTARFYDNEFTLATAIKLRPDNHTALLIVDMQYHDASTDQGFSLALERISPGSMSYYNSRVEEKVVPTINEILRYFRSGALPVVYVTLGTEYTDYRDFSRRGQAMMLELEQRSGVPHILWTEGPAFAIREEIAPLPEDVIIRKRTAGAFNSSDIDEVLRRMEIENLVVTGVTTSCCVESTARDAVDRGYSCVIVDDGTAEYDAEAHDATLRTFHGNFGRVLKTSGDVINAITREQAI